MQFSSYRIRDLEFKNRLIMLAMHTGFAEGNEMTERDFAFYEERAKGGAAAVTMVLGVNDAGALHGMYHADTLQPESLRTLANRVQAHGCRLIVQLFHCGRNENAKQHRGQPLWAPSAVASPIFRTEPQEMTAEVLEQTKADFVKAACFCKENGADAIEVSVSAGYLLSEFLSPLTNFRTDVYGYATEKGMRYPWEVLQAIRDAVTDYPILMKVSGAQMMEGGYTLSDTTIFCQRAVKAGWIDAITVTGGWHESPEEQISYYVEKGAFAPFAAVVKEQTAVPVIACNRIQDAETAERLLAAGNCDFVGTARAFLTDAHYVEKLQNKERYNPCQACNHCIMDVLKGRELRCAFCPEAGKEYLEQQRRKIATRKEVLVIGGGPVGMYAAKKAAERGFRTTLVTKEHQLGGQLQLAKLPPKKGDLGLFVAWLEEELQRLGVTIVYDTEATADFVLEKQPYLTVVASGSKPWIPPIPGLGREIGNTAQEVLQCSEAELKKRYLNGKTVILGGGSLGLETAAFLKTIVPEIDLEIIEQQPKMGIDLGAMARPLLRMLQKQKVSLRCNTRVLQGTETGIWIETDGQRIELPMDHMIWACGSEPESLQEVTMALMDERLSYAVVGDADHVADVQEGLESAFSLFSRFYLA